MRILLTGALGHIGSRFIHSLHPGDFKEVVLLDNLATQRYCSLFNLPARVPFRFVEADVLTADMESLFAGIDAVIHLAAITTAAGSFDNQEQVEKVNFIGTERVAQACLATGAKLLFLSTTSVYGTRNDVVDEYCTAEELKPQSPYATSKLRAEHFLQELGKTRGLQFAIFRFGTIFGISIGMRFHTAVNKFCWQACIGKPISVWRTALHQKRPYLYLSDAVRAINFILKSDNFDQQIYNVLTENSTVSEIVELIRYHVADLQIELVDAKIMNQLSFTVASARFRQLGFSFEGSLAKGIQETINLLKNVRASSKVN